VPDAHCRVPLTYTHQALQAVADPYQKHRSIAGICGKYFRLCNTGFCFVVFIQQMPAFIKQNKTFCAQNHQLAPNLKD
jgi:hypothetical protein